MTKEVFYKAQKYKNGAVVATCLNGETIGVKPNEYVKIGIDWGWENDYR